MDEILLTLVIATYNRKARLLNQLRSIYAQKESEMVKIIICDNHSDYDVRETIVHEFGEDKTNNTEIIVNSQNFGMGANLALMMLRSKTKWMWLLSDDDTTLPGSIKSILETIEENPNVGMIKFSIKGFAPHDDISVETLEGLIDYFYKTKHLSGDLIFISTIVYNRDLISLYFSSTLGYCYTLIPQLLPAFFALDKHETKVFFSRYPVVEFLQPENGDGWHLLAAAQGASILPTMPFDISFKYKKKLVEVIMSSYNHLIIIYEALSMKDRKYGKFLYTQVYNKSFRFFHRYYDCVLKFVYFVFYFLHINPSILIRLYPTLKQLNKKIFKVTIPDNTVIEDNNI